MTLNKQWSSVITTGLWKKGQVHGNQVAYDLFLKLVTAFKAILLKLLMIMIRSVR